MTLTLFIIKNFLELIYISLNDHVEINFKIWKKSSDGMNGWKT